MTKTSSIGNIFLSPFTRSSQSVGHNTTKGGSELGAGKSIYFVLLFS